MNCLHSRNLKTLLPGQLATHHAEGREVSLNDGIVWDTLLIGLGRKSEHVPLVRRVLQYLPHFDALD